MKKSLTRADYYEIKHHYLFFAFLLNLFRIVSIFILLITLAIVSIYTINENRSDLFNNIYHFFEKISPIIIPILIIGWILVKIVVVLFKRKLYGMKIKLDITDEI